MGYRQGGYSTSTNDDRHIPVSNASNTSRARRGDNGIYELRDLAMRCKMIETDIGLMREQNRALRKRVQELEAAMWPDDESVDAVEPTDADCIECEGRVSGSDLLELPDGSWIHECCVMPDKPEPDKEKKSSVAVTKIGKITTTAGLAEAIAPLRDDPDKYRCEICKKHTVAATYLFQKQWLHASCRAREVAAQAGRKVTDVHANDVTDAILQADAMKLENNAKPFALKRAEESDIEARHTDATGDA
jgi:hypothetical protein